METDTRKIAIAFLGTTVSGLAVAAEANQLKEADVRSLIIGKTIHLAAPMGGEIPLNYQPSGEVDGSGKALELGKFIQPTDKGRWWIQPDKRCLQFKVWYAESAMSFDVSGCRSGQGRMDPQRWRKRRRTHRQLMTWNRKSRRFEHAGFPWNNRCS